MQNNYFSNTTYFILLHITDSIRLSPVCILLLHHLVCPEKSFYTNTTLGVSRYEPHRSRFRRRPRSYRCSRYHPGLQHFRKDRRRPHQHATGSNLRSQRSQCLWYARPLTKTLTSTFKSLRDTNREGPFHETYCPRTHR